MAARAVPLARIDPAEARRMFIQKALVERDSHVTAPPLDLTAERISIVQALEERARRRNLLAGHDVLYDFYDSRVPAEVTGGSQFQRWWRRSGSRTPELLEVPFAVLVDRQGGPVEVAAYPDQWFAGGLPLPLRYRFEPGAPDDGVTVEIPLAALNRVGADGFDWNVPGYRLELVTALVRSLPKAVRRALGPAPQVAAEALEGTGPADGPLFEVMAARLSRLSGHPVSSAVWDRSALPPHLLMAFELRDGRRLLGRGRDLDHLRRDHLGEMRAALQKAAPELVRHGSTSWDFGDIPAIVERGPARAFPALVDEGESVGVCLLESREMQADSMWRGTRRLILLAARLPESHLQRRLTNETKLALALSALSLRDLVDDCATAVVDQVIVAHGGPSFTAARFEEMVSAAQRDMPDRVARVATIAGGVLAAAELVLDAADRLEQRYPEGALDRAIEDVRTQVSGLVHPGFVTESGTGRLRDILRYLDAAARRLAKLPGDALRDAERQAAVRRLTRRYETLLDRVATGAAPPGRALGLSEARWMIEEFRVSLWAQQLGTTAPVSEERIGKVLARMGG